MHPISFSAIRWLICHGRITLWSRPLGKCVAMNGEQLDAKGLSLDLLCMERCVCKRLLPLVFRSSLPSNWLLLTFKRGEIYAPTFRFVRRVVASKLVFVAIPWPISPTLRPNSSRIVYDSSKKRECGQSENL